MKWMKTITYQWDASDLERAEDVWASDGPETASRLTVAAESDIEPVGDPFAGMPGAGDDD